jgi:hypothetical protein
MITWQEHIMKVTVGICLVCLVGLRGTSALINDFEGGSPLAGWINDNSFDVLVDPADAGNNVLDTSDSDGNQITGVALTPEGGASETVTLQFDFRYRDAVSADLSVGMTELTTGEVSDIANFETGDIFGPTIRFVNQEIQVHDAGFEVTAQSVALNTWYTMEMVIDNDTDRWSGFISGGAYLSPTALSYGSDTSFAFRDSGTEALRSFLTRANNNNQGSNGLLLDNIQVIPEPSSLILRGPFFSGLVVSRLRARS